MAFVLNSAGVEAVLKSGEVMAALRERADQMVSAAQGIMVEGIPGNVPLPVTVEEMTTDRAKIRVSLAHPSGLAVQAKHGVLTGGAAGAGLEVTGRE